MTDQSAAKSLMAAELWAVVSNSLGWTGSGFCLRFLGRDTPRPATTIALYTLDVFTETVGRDESVTHPDESADACNTNASDKLFVTGPPPCPFQP
ncbi:MAG: hypothetical protein DRQ40_08955 [Gammaproteobacteria bacterium]|nr:MAG: hypothetical protein DRQ40_08955 [Gammaproteobacteria bacterium]